MRWAWLCVLTLTTGCVTGYRDGLGYRARQAALREDVAAFDSLMKEAAEKLPSFPQERPERTVLTHFLDLAGQPDFYPTVRSWIAKGYISDNQTCAIEKARARYGDPEAKRAATAIILERARAAAYTAGRSWEIDACLEYAPFLTVNSTVALRPYLALAGDPLEPRSFRGRILETMTDRYLQDVFTRQVNNPELPFAGHRAEAEAQRRQEQKRFEAIINAVAGEADPVLLAAGTARFALELERAAHTEGRSFFYDYAYRGTDPSRRDLVYAWVRSMKAREVDRRLESLGAWDREIEPGRDAYWYTCAEVDEEPVYGRADVRLRLLRKPQPEDVSCSQTEAAQGPYPLASVARYVATASVAHHHGVSRVRTRLLTPLR